MASLDGTPTTLVGYDRHLSFSAPFDTTETCGGCVYRSAYILGVAVLFFVFTIYMKTEDK
jgi:hypothetical protein